MIVEILTGIGGYATMGLLSARQVKHHIENKNDKTEYGKWLNSHHGHVIRDNGRRCRSCYGDANYWPYTRKTVTDPNAPAAVTGALWPVALPALAVFTAGKAAVHGVKPAVHWFFENPRHRKARRNNIEA